MKKKLISLFFSFVFLFLLFFFAYSHVDAEEKNRKYDINNVLKKIIDIIEDEESCDKFCLFVKKQDKFNYRYVNFHKDDLHYKITVSSEVGNFDITVTNLLTKDFTSISYDSRKVATVDKPFSDKCTSFSTSIKGEKYYYFWYDKRSNLTQDEANELSEVYLTQLITYFEL